MVKHWKEDVCPPRHRTDTYSTSCAVQTIPGEFFTKERNTLILSVSDVLSYVVLSVSVSLHIYNRHGFDVLKTIYCFHNNNLSCNNYSPVNDQVHFCIVCTC